MNKYGLLTTYSNTICNERGEQFVCNSFGDANRLRLSIAADSAAYEQRIAELEAEANHLRLERDAERDTIRRSLAERDEWKRRCEALRDEIMSDRPVSIAHLLAIAEG